jgi:hypothetical protein
MPFMAQGRFPKIEDLWFERNRRQQAAAEQVSRFKVIVKLLA